MSSLRERRRKRTADSICIAAVDLAFEHGLENVTVEMISDVAGISERTFFNYFPYKEMVFVPPRIDFSTEVFEDFVVGKGALIDDILKLFVCEIDKIGSDRSFFQKMHEISMKNPKIMNLRISAFHEAELKFSDLIALRFKDKLDADSARHMTAMIMVSIRMGIEMWTESGEGKLSESVAARLNAMKTLFNES